MEYVNHLSTKLLLCSKQHYCSTVIFSEFSYFYKMKLFTNVGLCTHCNKFHKNMWWMPSGAPAGRWEGKRVAQCTPRKPLWLQPVSCGDRERGLPLTGPQLSPQLLPLPWKETPLLFPTGRFGPSPFLGSKGSRGHLLLPKPPTPAQSRPILLSVLSDNKDTGGIYLPFQPANETIQWKAAPASWSLCRPPTVFSVLQFPSIYSTYKFSTVTRHHSSGKPICSFGYLISTSCFAFYYYC